MFLFVVLTAVVIAVFSIIREVAASLSPEASTSNSTTIALIATPAFLSLVATVLQIFGYSLRDLLPPKSTKELDKDRQQLLKSKDVELLKREAEIAYDKKDYGWAVAFAEAAINLRPKLGRAYQTAGYAYIRLGQAERAVSFGQRLTELEPLNPYGYGILADAYMDMNDWEKAIRVLELKHLYEDENSYQHTLSNLGRAHSKLGNLDEAIQYYKEYKGIRGIDEFLKQSASKELGRLEKIKREKNSLG
jgi:tetratricopeptide (TPR) repeat protein